MWLGAGWDYRRIKAPITSAKNQDQKAHTTTTAIKTMATTRGEGANGHPVVELTLG